MTEIMELAEKDFGKAIINVLLNLKTKTKILSWIEEKWKPGLTMKLQLKNKYIEWQIHWMRLIAD